VQNGVYHYCMALLEVVNMLLVKTADFVRVVNFVNFVEFAVLAELVDLKVVE
jgi:hypothetical protein